MSTRGIVAVGTPTKWRGVYNHNDSYPDGLGEDLKRLAQTRSLEEIAEIVRRHPQDFSSFPDSPYGEKEGPMTITSANHRKDDWLYWEYVYVIDIKAGKIWWGEHTYENGSGRPNAFKAGPPKTWHVLVSRAGNTIEETAARREA